MNKLVVRLQNTIADRKEERGAAMAEYGLLLALVALAAIAILATFGGRIKSVFEKADESLETGIAGAGGGTPAP